MQYMSEITIVMNGAKITGAISITQRVSSTHLDNDLKPHTKAFNIHSVFNTLNKLHSFFLGYS